LNDGVPPAGTVLTAPPNPIIVNIPPNLPIYSIDVECVATGIQHNSRSVAQVALVDAWSRPLFNVYIKQEKPVVSYLTELTGLTKEVLDTYGIPLGKSFLLPHFLFFILYFVFTFFSFLQQRKPWLNCDHCYPLTLFLLAIVFKTMCNGYN
jgi:hypothetical protein